MNNFIGLGFFSEFGFSTGYHRLEMVLMILSPPAQNFIPILQWPCQTGVSRFLNQNFNLIEFFWIRRWIFEF